MNVHDDNIMKTPSNANNTIKEECLQKAEKYQYEITENYQQISDVIRMFLRQERSFQQQNILTTNATIDFIEELQWKESIKLTEKQTGDISYNRRQSYHIYGEINHDEMEERDAILSQLDSIQYLQQQNAEKDNEIEIIIESICSLKQLHESVIELLNALISEFQQNRQLIEEKKKEIHKYIFQLDDILIENGWKSQKERTKSVETIQSIQSTQQSQSVKSNQTNGWFSSWWNRDKDEMHMMKKVVEESLKRNIDLQNQIDELKKQLNEKK